MSIKGMPRDFRGYGAVPPHARWPGGARLAVSVVVNVEEGAELSLTAGDERNERTYEVTDEVTGVPDPCMETHFEYGTRAGFWRVLRVLEAHGVPSTFNTCGRAVALSPWLAEEGVKRGHEISAHGWRWESHAKMDEAAEREAISKAVDAIERASGAKPVGWHTRSAASPNTRRILVERGHFLYDSDAYGDDLPHYVDVGGRPHLVLPYSFDTNDMHFHQGMQRFVTAADFAEYVIDAADWLWTEGADRPRMLSIGLHLRMIGRPGRIGGLDRVLKHLRDKGGVWFARRDEIARHWLATHPPA
ncbi:polysaccharide deacetylase family protein [Desertibaculum subflavum]|uniref:polysaccharide deacetylase family protein n=1 Tax=Desertibaculum subflavum TaxID=2268458 RepID=UPI000E6745C3